RFRYRPEGGEDGGVAPRARAEGGPRGGIGSVVLRQRGGVVAAQAIVDARVVIADNGGADVGVGELQAVPFEFEVVDDAPRQSVIEAGGQGHRAAAEGHRSSRAADRVGTVDHQHPATGPGQVEGAGHAVVAGTDDDGVIFRGRVHRPASRMISRAALAPGAPMTPPPGWVLEPHMYRFFTGARYWA